MEMVEHAADQAKVPLVLGGDHSVAIGPSPACRSIFGNRAANWASSGSTPTPT